MFSLSFSLCLHRKPTEREHHQVYGAIGGQIAQVWLLLSSLSFNKDMTTRCSPELINKETQTEQRPPRNFLSPPLSSNQIIVSSIHHLHTTSLTLFFLLLLFNRAPPAPLHISLCLSPVQFVFLFFPSLASTFLPPIYKQCKRKPNIFYLLLRASDIQRSGR